MHYYVDMVTCWHWWKTLTRLELQRVSFDKFPVAELHRLQQNLLAANTRSLMKTVRLKVQM